LPLYEYKCERCGHSFEKIESHSASATKKCPECGAKAKRMIAAPSVQFKGSGWYVTDYANKKSAEPSSESLDASASQKPQEKPVESKPASEKGTAKRKK